MFKSFKMSPGHFEGFGPPGSSKVSKGSGSLHMSKSAKTPKMSHSPGLHPNAAKAASCNRDTAHPSAKHEWKGAEEPLPSYVKASASETQMEARYGQKRVPTMRMDSLCSHFMKLRRLISRQ